MSRFGESRFGGRSAGDTHSVTPPGLVEHFFRHEYGRIVAVLARRIGMQAIEKVEDAVQSALLVALQTWTTAGVPANPSAWVYRVAYNNVVGELRSGQQRRVIIQRNAGELTDLPGERREILSEDEMQENLLRMMFVCCNDSIPTHSQIILALKILCGFDVAEIAQRLFTTTANVYKRLGRARAGLRKLSLDEWEVTGEQFARRLNAVHRILYALFSEGCFSSHAELAVRTELCNEAIRLVSLLAEHPAGQTPETYALAALMYLHSARMSARTDGSGGLLLLEEQDRTLWDRRQVHTGLEWLARSAHGNLFSRYHAEAGIAAEHCLAPTFQETRWERIVELYELLQRQVPSALPALNKAIAIAEWKGPQAGLAILGEMEKPDWLTRSYQWHAVQSDLLGRCGDAETAERFREIALRLAPSSAVRELLRRRLHRDRGEQVPCEVPTG